MNFASICSGIGAPECAWPDWNCQFTAEIEAFPSAVLKHHYLNVPNYGDITRFKEWPAHKLDVLIGGTPCQSFSVAGLRKGMADPRGNLALTFLAIVDRYAPTWICFENVPGLLSSDEGRAFGAFLGGLAKLGYGFAYRILDAQYFGLAQRRKRVFVVGCIGGQWKRAAGVLFERESLCGDPAPRREAGEGTAPTIAGCSNGGGANGPGRAVDDCEYLVARSQRARANASHREDSDNYIAATLQSHHKNTQLDQTMVAHALRGEGFDASEDGSGRRTPLISCPELAPSWTARDVKGERQDVAEPSFVVFDTTQITSKVNYSNPKQGQPSHPLARGQHPPAIAWSGVATPKASEEIALTLKADQGREGAGVAYGFNSKQAGETQLGYSQEQSPPIRTNASDAAQVGYAVRRLTPRECERLQGFPDDYTLIEYRGKPAADGPRYKALGNSMAVPVIRWIGRRIELVHGL